MSHPPIFIASLEDAADNQMLPFRIEGSDVRGRAARLGMVADQILSAHNYPHPVGAVLGEALALAALLGSLLKYDGKLTLQTKGSGPVPLMVADYQAGGLRGYAKYDPARVTELQDAPSFSELTGKGYLAITLDPGGDMESYQGIVALEDATLAGCAKRYFAASEQTVTDVSLAAEKNPVTGHWRAGGLMIQLLPDGSMAPGQDVKKEQREDWNRASILMKSVKKPELVDPKLPLPDLLYRLYHEQGVRVFDPAALHKDCRCSEEKMMAVIASLPAEDIREIAEEGAVTMTCEFCNRDFKVPV